MYHSPTKPLLSNDQNPISPPSSSPLQEPHIKNLKMPTTTTISDDEDPTTTISTTKNPKPNQTKLAILLAYCGSGYQGMQTNPGAKTIESDLHQALYISGAVPENDRGHPQRYDFARSARTDKGVSAVGQVVSGKFYVDPPGLVERLNDTLPPQIRVFGYKRVIASFSAKKLCDRRRYVYLLPVFALDPSSHRDRESVLASLGSGNELVKCFECSERGRKVFRSMGIPGTGETNVSRVEGHSGISSNTLSALSVDSSIPGMGTINGSKVESQSGISSNTLSAVSLDNNIPGMGTTDGSKVESQSGVSSNTLSALSLGNSIPGNGTRNGSKVGGRLGISANTLRASSLDNSIAGMGTTNGSKVENQSGVSSNMLSASTLGNSIPGTGRRNGSKIESRLAISSNTLGAVSLDNGNVCKVALNSESDAVNASGNGEDDNIVKEKVFSYGDKERQRFNKILKQYEGTHNFHNFTTRTKAADPSANRCIIMFSADTTVTIDGIEFVKCEVVGQSFMLHQIRKMIGVAVAIMRNSAPESFIETALQQDVNVNVPTAPEVGLYLDECFFSSYNEKWKDTHEEVSMKAYAEDAEEFKLKHIYSHIASTEHKEGAVAVWLHSLNHRNYPDLVLKENSGAKKVAGTQTDETTRLLENGVLNRALGLSGLSDRHSGDAGKYPGLQTENGIPSHIEPDSFSIRPLHVYGKPTVHEIDLDHLATAMKNRLNLVLPWMKELRVCYSGWAGDDTGVTDTIISDVNMMVDTAMAVTYNRLRYILQSQAPTVCAAQMNPRSPLSNKYKFPAFISSVLGGIGPLWIRDGPQDMCIVYATSSDRSQMYGRGQPFEFNCGQFFRLIDSLAAMGAPLAPIDVKGGKLGGWFYPTILMDREEGLWSFTATCHYSNYRHRDIVSAWLTLNDDPALRAFGDSIMKIESCTDPDVVSAVIASRPDGVPDDLDGATAPARPVGGGFNVNVFGVRPAVAAEGGNAAVPAAVYVLGRGDTRYYCCTSLARNLNEYDMNSILREYILGYNTSWTSPRFQTRDYA